MKDFPFKGQFDHLGLDVIEDLPRLKNFRELGIAFAKEGQTYLPTSNPKMPSNVYNLMKYMTAAPDEKILGHIVAPWCPTLLESKPKFEKAFDDFVAAKGELYPDK
jgi:hypothetical protein